MIVDNFVELHGDRHFGDDLAMVGGIGFIDGIPVTVIGNQKGRNLKETIDRNGGMANPEGYRKALRLAKQAEKKFIEICRNLYMVIMILGKKVGWY